MQPLQTCATPVVAEALKRQPLTLAKVRFCWRLVAGAAIDRATEVTLASGVLRVIAADATWQREVERVVPLLHGRLATLLGERSVGRIEVRRRTGS